MATRAGAGDQPPAQARHAADRRAADVTMVDVVEGPVEFVDTATTSAAARVQIKPVQVVAGGVRSAARMVRRSRRVSPLR